jgi:hypothetical protein
MSLNRALIEPDDSLNTALAVGKVSFSSTGEYGQAPPIFGGSQVNPSQVYPPQFTRYKGTSTDYCKAWARRSTQYTARISLNWFKYFMVVGVVARTQQALERCLSLFLCLCVSVSVPLCLCVCMSV